MEAVSNLVVGSICLAYGAYCMLKGGTHFRGRGWLTKEEGPRGFIFSMALYFLIGLISLIYFLYLNFR